MRRRVAGFKISDVWKDGTALIVLYDEDSAFVRNVGNYQPSNTV